MTDTTPADERFEAWWRSDPENGTFDPKTNALIAWQARAASQPAHTFEEFARAFSGSIEEAWAAWKNIASQPHTDLLRRLSAAAESIDGVSDDLLDELRAAASQPAQKPVGKITLHLGQNRVEVTLNQPFRAGFLHCPVYAAPPADTARLDRIMELLKAAKLAACHKGWLEFDSAMIALEREVRKP